MQRVERIAKTKCRKIDLIVTSPLIVLLCFARAADCHWSSQANERNALQTGNSLAFEPRVLGPRSEFVDAKNSPLQNAAQMLQNEVTMTANELPAEPVVPKKPSSSSSAAERRAAAMELSQKLATLEARIRSSTLPRLRGFIRRSGRLTKKLRRRKLYFFDSLVLKSQKYGKAMAADGEDIVVGISEASASLDRALAKKVSDWKLRYLTKEINRNCWPERAEKFEHTVALKVAALKGALDDIVRQYSL